MLKLPVAATVPVLKNTSALAIAESFMIFPVIPLNEQRSLFTDEDGPVTKSLATFPLIVVTVRLLNVGDEVVAIA
jgi:hypothetical protein